MAFSFDNNPRKNESKLTMSHFFCPASLYRNPAYKAASENNMDIISSLPLILATASVCIGCATKMIAATKGIDIHQALDL